MEQLYIGKIVGTHGIKGEVKIKCTSSFANERFKKGNKITLSKDGQTFQLECLRHRQHKGVELVTFKDHEDINLVEKYRGYEIYGEYDATLLGENEYFYQDLIGCNVYNQHQQLVGIVGSIMENPRYEILVVKKDDGKDMLIPYIEAFILEEKIEEKYICFNQLEGM